MAGKIAWTIEFLNIDAQLVKLRQIDTILNSISRKGALLGGTGGINIGGAGGGTTIVGGIPTSTASSAGASARGAAAGAAAGAAVSGLAPAAVKFNSKIKAIRDDINKAASQMGQTREEFLKKGGFRQRGAPMPTVNPRTGLERFIEIQKEQWGERVIPMQKGKDGIWTTESDRFHRPDIHLGQSQMGRNASAWAITQGRKLGEMFGNGPAGAKMGASFAGMFTPLRVIALGLTVALLALHKAVQLLTEGIKEGAEAYQHAAKLGMGIGSTYAATYGFKAIGMEAMDLSVLQGQFNPKAKKYNVPDTDMILGAARAGQFGNAQQLMNMENEFRMAMKDAESSARQMEKAAKSTQYLNMETSAIAREWNVMLSQAATVLMPAILLTIEEIKTPLESINWVLEKMVDLLAKLKLIEPGSKFTGLPGRTGNSGPSFGSWEKMGFVMTGPKEHNNVATIAKNSGEIVHILSYIAGQMKQSIIKGFAWNILQGMPFMPNNP